MRTLVFRVLDGVQRGRLSSFEAWNILDLVEWVLCRLGKLVERSDGEKTYKVGDKTVRLQWAEKEPCKIIIDEELIIEIS